MKPFTIIAIVVFVLVSLAHLARFVFGWEIVVNNWSVPMELSIAGFLVVCMAGSNLDFTIQPPSLPSPCQEENVSEYFLYTITCRPVPVKVPGEIHNQ